MSRITSVRVIAIPGAANDAIDIDEAISCVEASDVDTSARRPAKYAIVIRSSDGSKVDGEFRDKLTAVEFLHVFQG